MQDHEWEILKPFAEAKAMAEDAFHKAAELLRAVNPLNHRDVIDAKLQQQRAQIELQHATNALSAKIDEVAVPLPAEPLAALPAPETEEPIT